MSFALGFFIGLLVGSVAFYYVYRNNKTKLDEVAKTVQAEIDRLEAALKSKTGKE